MRNQTAVSLIIKINIAVFLLWMIIPNIMITNFLVSWSGVTSGRVWTLITSVFSHSMFFHLFINLYCFYGFGFILENVIGTKRFWQFYLTAGVVASFCHCFVSYFLMGQPDLPALGASGAISGVIMLFSLMYPHEKLMLLGFIPMPAMFGAVLFVGLDVWGLVAQTQGGTLPIGHGAHLGGAMYGAIYYLVVIKKKKNTNQLVF